ASQRQQRCHNLRVLAPLRVRPIAVPTTLRFDAEHGTVAGQALVASRTRMVSATSGHHDSDTFTVQVHLAERPGQARTPVSDNVQAGAALRVARPRRPVAHNTARVERGRPSGAPPRDSLILNAVLLQRGRNTSLARHQATSSSVRVAGSDSEPVA